LDLRFQVRILGVIIISDETGGPKPVVDLPEILAALKRALKARGMTYRDLAKALSMSESGVKKWLTSKDCSLGRVLAACEAIGVSLEDLLRESAAPPGAPVDL
jgi:transcriptional regulator with XRE-family HTH domain